MLSITFPDNLPVSAHRRHIEQALQSSQVLIVCGETGSGKTTQLPKMLLALKQAKQALDPQGAPSPALATKALADGMAAKPYGQRAAKGRRPKIIAHTQPRRIAASSVAKRIAEELKSPLGEIVGYKVRFTDRVSARTQIKLMTDGILLAETQTDPDLLAYDGIIIDEAHERSLNIDFLLGYLRQLLPRRPDLTVIVTSATIDAQRFARHFASAKGDAPIITVSGRTYPVELRYRPMLEAKDYDLNDAIADALDELWREPQAQGDVLVFLPGEREIREASEHLRQHLARSPVLRQAQVLSLFARLSAQEQERIFAPHTERRVVLATNVAETSLTVPGIRYVIDTGLARIKRYSYRNKVEQLLVEPISQAAANQRAGRCGRVASGVCIRLYEELDFQGRSLFSDPEIQRSSLAAVILRMKALHLGRVEQFPFIDAPSSRAIADGYQLLNELGALDDALEITPLGVQLAKLPLDPRLGRMLLQANTSGALQEVLVIASAMSVQDVRDRPIDQQTQADQAHAKFDDDKSEFVGYLKLWKWLEEGASAAAKGAAQHAPKPALAPAAGKPSSNTPAKETRRQFEQRLRANYISVRRVREWRDIHQQLSQASQEQDFRLNPLPASFEALHTSLMAGLLGNLGVKSDEGDWYLGARGIKFYPHPGRHLSKRPGRWIVCAELVETTRLFGRGLATIDPQWIEQVAGHLLKKQLLDPHWEKKAGQVVALERASLYGLVIYHNRRADYARVDPAAAREMFIREALVAGEWQTALPFFQANQKTIAKVQELEHQSRRQDVLVDDELIYAFYDQHIPHDVTGGRSFEHWYKQTVRSQPQLLLLTREELMRHEASGITTEQFPKIIRLGSFDCKAAYLHEPSHANDGLTLEVPIYALNQVPESRCDWLVPGMLKDKVWALLKSLPQRPRARLVPLPAAAQRLSEQLCQPGLWAQGSLLEALLKLVREATGLTIERHDFKQEALSTHHLMNFRVVDAQGRQLGIGRNLAALKLELGSQARGAFQALASLKLGGQVSSVPASAPLATAATAAATGEHQASAAKLLPSAAVPKPLLEASQKFTSWSFGELPELMEIETGGQNLVGFPALVDAGDGVRLEVFDEPEVALAKHRLGLRRLVALQLKDALKYLDKNLPELQKMAMAFMPLGSIQELKEQIIHLALERAFLAEPLPSDEAGFKLRVQEGRGRLNLIAGEVAKNALWVLEEFALVTRKIKDSKGAAEALADIEQQLKRLMPKNFIAVTPYAQLQHLPRYLQAIVLRLTKWRADPARDSAKMAEIRPLEQQYLRRLAEQKGKVDARLNDYGWLLQELRVSLFAQELRTPQPVSVKRLEKAWSILRA